MRKRPSSRIPGLHRRPPGERCEIVARWAGVDAGGGWSVPLDEGARESLIENAIGSVDVPMGVATNFLVNGYDLLVPMAIEEPSVVAAASNAARMVRAGGGFRAEADPSLTVAQVEILDAKEGAAAAIQGAAEEIRDLASRAQPEIVSLGGGPVDVRVRSGVGDPRRLVVHLAVDCLDAMGANTVNSMAEAVSDRIAELSGGRAGLRILTNLADRRLARASCSVPIEALARGDRKGEEVAAGVEAASRFAQADPYRAATHNKGIHNGVDALLLATGNDWRAVEAGAHAWASLGGGYRPLSDWRLAGGSLEGSIEMPMAVGIVGGASRAHPAARRAIEILGVESAAELAWVAVSVGLASNLAALAALSAEGIQQGHMRLHRRRTRGSEQG